MFSLFPLCTSASGGEIDLPQSLSLFMILALKLEFIRLRAFRIRFSSYYSRMIAPPGALAHDALSFLTPCETTSRVPARVEEPRFALSSPRRPGRSVQVFLEPAAFHDRRILRQDVSLPFFPRQNVCRGSAVRLLFRALSLPLEPRRKRNRVLSSRGFPLGRRWSSLKAGAAFAEILTAGALAVFVSDPRARGRTNHVKRPPGALS